MQRILITGGAGFIGSHLADELLDHGYMVKVLDNLCPQVHGENAKAPEYLSSEVEFVYGDVRDMTAVRKAMQGMDAVFHLAASVGVGQSMYEIAPYTSTNNYGTSILCQCIADGCTIGKLIVASSMSIYGEGSYVDPDGLTVPSAVRSAAQLRAGKWELLTAEGKELRPVPTAEGKQPDLASIYALSKYDQERMCLITGTAYNVPTAALRLFNVFGTRQALSNPYTGVLAIFASRLLNDNAPMIYEDGRQRRDFVSVRDVVRAMRLVLENPDARDDVYNIGSGRSYAIVEVAAMLAGVMEKSIDPLITGKYRVGDIRHCFADISKAQSVLGYTPSIALADGLYELTEWLGDQISVDRVEAANQQLTSRGLTL
ncbi:MAG: NAD-dependent epimerase/dehydratase family protein [Phycisphaerae bacterium]|nr:NAD-dependent epimerase/dehydratase family protein [Phycisphaerae bacterium]